MSFSLSLLSPVGEGQTRSYAVIEKARALTRRS